MHLSLKGSLIRSPMLNRVGQRLLQLFEGASAAYSLRDLASNIASVVRVRRASDNSEKDFSAADVSSGAMTQWVNGQVVPPLDVRELVDGERTGDLVEAAAAYSLRNLSTSYTGDVVEVRRNTDGATLDFSAAEVADGTLTDWVNTSFADTLPLDTASGAAAAYSLRNLSTGYTGNVVDVRRSSDDAEESFTAAEVADGTLEDWVNESVSFTAGNIFFSSSETLINESSTAFEATSNGGTFDVRAGGQNYTDIVSGEVTVTLTASNFSSSQSIDFEAWTPTGTSTYITAGTITGNGDYTFTFNVTEDGAGSIFRFRGLGLTSGDTLSVSNLSLSYTKASGFVTQWYDQSGNGNHATQGTDASQPKIVDAGTLVSGGLDFDGVNDFLELGDLGLSQPNSVVFVHNSDTDGAGNTLKNEFLDGTSVSSGRTLIDQSGASYRIFAGGDATGTSKTIVANQDALVFTTLNGSSSEFALDGSNETALNSGTNSMDEMTLGASISGGRYDGTFAEFIIYDSDQSANRQAIEENIGSNYGITLTSSKDGTVSTWYDQSGNGNDATQTDVASQPKIVDAGSLVSGGLDFDGVDDFLEVTPISTASTALSTFIFGDAQSNVFSYPIGTTNNAGIGVSDTSFRYNLISGTPILEDWSSTLGGKNIYTFIHDGTTSVPNVSGYRNGAIGSQTSAEQGAAPSDNIRYIGTRNQVQDFNGVIGEIIIYPSDQSDNRTAIEANIGDTYNIDLPSGVDTGYDQVDGFVETWYDQSGNGNDAVQQVSGNQPKIVDAGVLVTNDEGNPAIQGATGKSFGLSPITGLEDVSIFFVGSVPPSFQAITGWNTNLYMVRFGASYWEFVANLADPGNMDWNSALTSGDTALFNFTRSSGTVTGYANSVASDTTSNANSNPFGLNRIFTRSAVNYNDYQGKASELIIYNSDQSANRAAIETNINNQYDIY